MRYLTGVIRPVEKLHPVEATLSASSSVRPVAIHQTKVLDDGTCVTLLEVSGDLDELDRILTDHEAVFEHTIAGERDGYVYLQTDPYDLTRYLIELQENSALIVQFPIEHTGDGGLRGTVIGDQGAFGPGVAALPDELDLEVESTGEYHPEMETVFATLTDRQREILATAIRLGYYEDPRRAAQQDIAEAMDIASGTVSEHLRRIEATVFSESVIDGWQGGQDW